MLKKGHPVTHFPAGAASGEDQRGGVGGTGWCGRDGMVMFLGISFAPLFVLHGVYISSI